MEWDGILSEFTQGRTDFLVIVVGVLGVFAFLYIFSKVRDVISDYPSGSGKPTGEFNYWEFQEMYNDRLDRYGK